MLYNTKIILISTILAFMANLSCGKHQAHLQSADLKPVETLSNDKQSPSQAGGPLTMGASVSLWLTIDEEKIAELSK